MNNIEDMQKAFEDQKFKVFSPFKCDISKNEDGNYVDDTTIFAFAWFCRGIASQAQQTESKQGCKECDGQTYMHSPTGEYLGECPYCTKEQEPYAYELKLV